jgi:hypothetical protein
MRVERIRSGQKTRYKKVNNMRTSLIIFGVIFLVIGGLLYFLPLQQIKADTTTVGNGTSDTRTSSAQVTVPAEWALASAIIGLILLILGMVIASPGRRSDSRRDSYEKRVETNEDIDVGDGNRHKIVRERTETHRTR